MGAPDILKQLAGPATIHIQLYMYIYYQVHHIWSGEVHTSTCEYTCYDPIRNLTRFEAGRPASKRVKAADRIYNPAYPLTSFEAGHRRVLTRFEAGQRQVVTRFEAGLDAR